MSNFRARRTTVRLLSNHIVSILFELEMWGVKNLGGRRGRRSLRKWDQIDFNYGKYVLIDFALIVVLFGSRI